jgi:hypothetical protein
VRCSWCQNRALELQRRVTEPWRWRGARPEPPGVSRMWRKTKTASRPKADRKPCRQGSPDGGQTRRTGVASKRNWSQWPAAPLVLMKHKSSSTSTSTQLVAPGATRGRWVAAMEHPASEYDQKHVSLISPPCRAWSLTNGLSVRRVTAPYTWHAGNTIQSLGQCDIDCLSRLQKVDSQVTVRAKYQTCTGNAPKSIQPSHVDTELHIRMAARERISCWSGLLASTSLLPLSEMVLFGHGQRTAERDQRLDEPSVASIDRTVQIRGHVYSLLGSVVYAGELSRRLSLKPGGAIGCTWHVSASHLEAQSHANSSKITASAKNKDACSVFCRSRPARAAALKAHGDACPSLAPSFRAPQCLHPHLTRTTCWSSAFGTAAALVPYSG